MTYFKRSLAALTIAVLAATIGGTAQTPVPTTVQSAPGAIDALKTLTVKANEKFRVVKLDWKGGLRYPRLERVDSTPDRLGDILTARSK